MLNLSSEFQDKLNDNTERVIRTRVELYDTHFPVESNGFNFVVYEWTGDVSTAPNWSTEANLDRYFPDSDYGNLDNLMLSWGTGVPFDLPLNQFAIEFTGYFYVDADEALTHDYLYFYLAGEGITAQLLWGVGETELVAATELQTKKDVYTRGVTTFTSGTWQPIKIRIWGRNGYNDGGFVALYQYGPPNLGNMIFNPAFSAGISGWTGVSGVNIGLSTTYYYSSSPGLTISDGWGFARGTINNAIYKDNEYSLSFRMRNLYGATNQVRVRVSGCGEYQTISIPSGSSWVLQEITFTAIEDFTGDPFVTLQPLYGSVAVDDFSLTLGEDQDYHKEDLSVLNAGIVNTTNAYLTAHVLRGVMEIAGTLIDNEPGEYSIILPYSSNGYVKDINNNWYEDSEDSNIVLREGKLIKIYSGYKLDSEPYAIGTEGYVDADVEYVPRFTGFIENFEIDLKSNRLVVSCRDVLSLTDSSFCMNFPDAVSYWAAGYFRSDLDDQPNGVNMPAAYDRWQVVKAVKDLLLKSGISYSLLKGKEYRSNKELTPSYCSDADGNTYGVIQIGTQLWMSENLKTTRYQNGDSIVYVPVGSSWNSTSEGRYGFYNDDSGLRDDYGLLYNFAAVDDSRDLSPVGWRVPTKDDADRLAAYLGGEAVAGGKLKETGTVHWLSPNTGATDEFGFTGLPAGQRNIHGTYENLGEWGVWWVNEIDSSIYAYTFDAVYNGTDSYVRTQLRGGGRSVRCIYEGNEVVETTPLIRNTTYLLDPGRNYGTDEEGEYNYSFGIGSRVFECVMKLIDTYGYRIAVRYDGCIRIQPTNNATDKQSPFSYLSQTGVVDTVNYKSQHGHYVSIPDNSSEVQYGFTGTGLAILFVRGETSGTADNNNEYWSGTDSVQVTLRQSGSSADYLIKQFNLYYSQTSGDDRFFRDGVDYELGDNPCYILIAQNLPYDSYYVDIEMLTNHSVGIEQLWVYNYNYTEIEKSLGTYLDSTNIGTIRDLKYSRGLDNYRNDILVAGRRLGVWTAAGESEDIADTIGRNPVYLNVHSRLIDIDSIYNPNAHNYTGRRQMTYIQEPSISTESRAQWLAYSVLSTYRTLNNHPQFVVWGDPQIQIGDCVSVYDKREEDGNTKMWIKGIDEKINSSSWEVACTVTSIEPYPSYEENQDMDIEEFADNYAINIEVGDTYGDEGNSRHSTNDASSVLATTVTPSSTSIILTDGSDFDTSGTVMLSHDSQPHYCVFTYTGKSTNTLTGAVYQYGTTTSYAAGSYTVHQKYNPYESEDYDVKLRLTFTCLVKGRVRVGIKSEDHTGWIAGLSDNGGLEGETDVNPKWQDVWPGDDVPFIWGGVDQVGVTNDKQGFIAEDYSYYFEIIYEREFDQSSMTYSLNKVFSDKDGNDTDIRIIRTSLSNVDYAVVSINSFSGRNESLEYSQTSGDNGGGITYVGLGWVSYLSAYMTDNTNYIYTSSDGAISGELETYYIEGKRQYWVTAVHEVHRYTTRVDNSTNRTKINPSYEPHTNGNPIPLDSNKLVIGFGKNNSYAFSYNPSRGKWRAVLMPDNDFRNYLALDDYYGIGYWSVFRLFIKDASGRDITLISSSGSLDDEDLSAIVVDGTTYSPYMYYYADKKIWSRSYNRLERVYEDTPSINIEFYWIPEAINNSSYGLGDYFRQAPDFPSGSNHGFGYLLRGSYRGPRPNIGGVFFEPGNESIPLKLNYTKDWWT